MSASKLNTVIGLHAEPQFQNFKNSRPTCTTSVLEQQGYLAISGSQTCLHIFDPFLVLWRSAHCIGIDYDCYFICLFIKLKNLFGSITNHRLHLKRFVVLHVILHLKLCFQRIPIYFPFSCVQLKVHS